jgi:hypothetical protein
LINKNRLLSIAALGCSVLTLVRAPAAGQANAGTEDAEARLARFRQRIDAEAAKLEALRRALVEQESSLEEMRRALGIERLSVQRGAGPASDPNQRLAQGPAPVGQAPEEAPRRPDVAPIFEQPGVLTPKGKYVVEPSLQYAYSSSNRVSLVGYTVIPAILVGLIDIREVRRSTFTGALTGRFGITNRFELEAKVPYVYRADTGIGREFLQGASTNSTVFDSTGRGIGDVEVTGRYQFNDGGLDRPYYIGSLRVKTRTGKDPFEVMTSKTVLGFRNDGIQTELPTGSGFYGIQPAVTMLYPSDPAVFFGTLSYLHTFSRSNVSRNTDLGTESLGKVSPGGIFGFNFGMGLGLNEKSSFSIGYDHASVGKTKVEGQPAVDSVRIQLGTLLLGYSYRLSDQRTLNVSLGAGLTRDTPDVTLTVRMPFSF